jgi:hypothetical protein
MQLIEAFTPSTESLYQFIAIGGLVVFMFFQYLLYQTFRARQKKRWDLQRATAPLYARTREAQKQGIKYQEKLSELYKRSSELVGRQNPSEADKAEQAKILEETNAIADAFRELNKTLNAVADDTEDEVGFKEWKDVNAGYYRMVVYHIVVSIVSIVVCAIGFYYWYWRIQYYQDLILLHKALAPLTSEMLNR